MLENNIKKTLINKCIKEIRYNLYISKKALKENNVRMYEKLIEETLTEILFMFKIELINSRQFAYLMNIWENPKNIKKPY